MWHDISIPLGAATPEWPGDHPFTCGWTLRREDGESVNLAAITTSLHVGTHADAPVHVDSEWPASDALELAAFVGDAIVIALPSGHPIGQDIDRALLQDLLGVHAVTRVLLRTGYTSATGVFPDDWPALTPDAAAWLVDRGVKLWGVDAPSVDRRHSKTLDVHHALLGRGSFVLENLDLRDIAPGAYELIAPPVAVIGADAAPVRALLRTTRAPDPA
ncbi:MAG TPA: cyclase family protein [Gemmatimonas sp.]|uniref:cyclase family protein n=1 Tax=Gemmatimonas sp. TaxID=1962908 RepID=UPI002ED7A6AD